MGTRLLVIGPETLRERLAASLPACEVARAGHVLEGLWRSGSEAFRGVLVSPDLGTRLLPAVRGLRKVAPQARIVVACDPIDEPAARRALDLGASDYVLEPLRREDVERAFGVAGPREHFEPVGSAPADTRELDGLGGVLQCLSQGPGETLEALADLIRATLGATGVSIQLDDLAATSGTVGEPVLEELIERAARPVGRIAVGRRGGGAYSAAAAQRLRAYARLVEAVVAPARALEHWRQCAWTDELSGLRNRRYFDKRLDELLADAARRRGQLSLFVFDLDNFKSYNDRFGHEAGDTMIREVAQVLRTCTREADVVARLGGDEFAVVFWESEKPRVPGSKHPDALVALTQRFRRLISEHPFQFLGADRPGPVTISGGLAAFPWDGKSRAELMRAADEALLCAKRTGKNAVGIAGFSDPRGAAAPAE